MIAIGLGLRPQGVIPESQGGDGGGEQDADIIQQEAVSGAAFVVAAEMNKEKDDQEAAVCKEQGGVYKYHGVFKRGMFHLLHILYETGNGIGQDHEQTGADDRGAGYEGVALPADQRYFSSYKEQQGEQKDLPVEAGDCTGEEQ